MFFPAQLLSLLLLLLLANAETSLPQLTTAPGELARAQGLVDAWARTGSCNATRFAARCGVVAALVTSGGAPTVVQAAAGAGASGPGAQFGLDTLFEIASNTKVLTAITFHRLVQEGILTEDATLRSMLPADKFNVTFANPQVGTITMREILSHHSGLPRLPSNLHGTPANHFTNYSQRDLFFFLSNLQELPTRGRFLYSNLGFGLLGYLMELKTGSSYEDLVYTQLLQPLEMFDSKVVLSPQAWHHDVAPGYQKNGSFAERNTPYGVLQGQGAYHSSIRDMSKLLAAHLQLQRGGLPHTLAAAMNAAMVPLGSDEFLAQRGEVASAWQIYQAAGSAVIWKSGGTAGYGSFMAVNSATGRAAVALGSCGNCGDKAVQELTRQLVDLPQERPPMPTPVPTPAELELLIGCYTLQGDTDTTFQVRWQSSVRDSRVSLSINVNGTDGDGSASLEPFSWTGQLGVTASKFRSIGMMPLALALRGNDTVVVRPKGVSGGRVAVGGTPLQDADLKYSRRELYFLAPEMTVERHRPAEAAVLHVNGWDLYATRTACADRIL